MKFDIARQPLVPAFLTLAALAVVAMWSAGGPAVSMAVQAGHAAGTVDIGRNAAGALAVSSPGELLAQFQAAHPVWARWIAGLLMLFTGMSVGRLTVRYNLYSVGTCLAIPLYGAIACGLAVGGEGHAGKGARQCEYGNQYQKGAGKLFNIHLFHNRYSILPQSGVVLI